MNVHTIDKFLLLDNRILIECFEDGLIVVDVLDVDPDRSGVIEDAIESPDREIVLRYLLVIKVLIHTNFASRVLNVEAIVDVAVENAVGHRARRVSVQSLDLRHQGINVRVLGYRVGLILALREVRRVVVLVGDLDAEILLALIVHAAREEG